ncbi:DUF397 domain-containing protein [Saccharopolyspora cebuensis]|uniref:DUF397 domain-containing protein n=1 Tax=Saccharopolyspora cebuensis TaxID=418759 RepID=A0ABV4CQG5_9PSEU
MQKPRGWRTSSYTQPNGNCVEVGRLGDGAAVRDTKHRAGGYFTTTPGQWTTFITAIKTDRFR